MNKALRVLSVGVAVAALALTGCAGSPSSAAVVGGVGIADTTVRGVARSIVDATGTDPSVALKQATYDLVLGEASRQIATATGKTISAADKAAVVGQNQLAAAVSATEEGAPWGDAVGTTYVLLGEMEEAQYLAELNKVDIAINPRYGQWEPTRITIVPATLASPAIVVNS